MHIFIFKYGTVWMITYDFISLFSSVVFVDRRQVG